MKKEDIEKAVFAFRYACPYSSLLKHFDGNKEPHNCWEWKSELHDYTCKGFICKRLREFINILKEPEQDSLPDFKEP